MLRQTRLNHFADHVQQKLVRFLDARGAISRHDHLQVSNSGTISAIATEQRDCT